MEGGRKWNQDVSGVYTAPNLYRDAIITQKSMTVSVADLRSPKGSKKPGPEKGPEGGYHVESAC